MQCISSLKTQNLDGQALNELIAPSPPYAALIFDCDGTLANTLPVHCQIWMAAFRKFGAEVPEAWYYERTGLPAAELIAAFNQSFGYTIDENTLDAERQKHFAELIHQVQEVDAVAAIARANSGKVPMAVASNGQKSIVEPTVEAIGLRSLFHTIVTLDDVSVGKPAPDLFLLAAERMGVEPHGCIVYEDSDTGLEAARRAGMRWVDVRVLWRES
ncbi:HAD family phosphatase [Leptolyngbya sp. FACHB-541]|uniref:HAD family hydrolase n=1 Tax=Leptolyngbya sp. FACHB-541 TaxID=2692810 RepID=UPI001682978E|nr:HAD family phosphatase [Leptolyngbya sp. FACHB-541]MBD1995594.1 HAD family phosphatase [Leptolyngbya sp. FACHB-541]